MKNLEKVLIVGAGISGAVCARELAEKGHKCLVIEKRPHIAGNCYDYIDNAGVLVPKYGPHLFHTNDKGVWEYVQRFGEFVPYEHRVLASVDGKIVPVPVNITTVNTLFGENIQDEEGMKDWLSRNTEQIEDPQNSEEVSLKLVGRELYEKIFKNYTIKQWNTDPKNLRPEVMARIPVRFNFEDRYFTDEFQGMPRDGYTRLFENLLDHENIEVRVNEEYSGREADEKIIFTGKIDMYFDEIGLPKLQYRSLEFVHHSFPEEYKLPSTTFNLPQDTTFTRVTEPKRSTGQKCKNTTLIYEIPRDEGEPYYPHMTDENLALYEEYKKHAVEAEKDGVFFLGRLANFKYFNMDAAFRNALDFVEDKF